LRYLSERTVLSTLMERLASATSSSLLLDYDGTLAPFQIDRHCAYPYPEVLPLLESILKSGRSRVVVITGRSIEEVEPLLGPLRGIEIWGSHGLEHRLANGTYRQIAIDPETTALLAQAEAWLTAAGFAQRTEVKPGGIAVHWRGMTDAQIDRMRECTREGLSVFADRSRLKLLGFEGGLELRLAYPNKGDAVTSILSDLDRENPVVYLGDDLTDEDAFRALHSRGLGILVRREFRETSAQLWLRPPDELIDFLQQWLSSISG
jgi:trehalose 6-phosphate phosphatase